MPMARRSQTVTIRLDRGASAAYAFAAGPRARVMAAVVDAAMVAGRRRLLPDMEAADRALETEQ